VTADELRALVLTFPGVEESASQGSIAFKVKAKVFCRLGARTAEDDLMLTGIGFDEAELLIGQDPEIFHTTPHFSDARCVLARLPALDAPTARRLLERRWREIAPKAAVKAWDAR
jgi:hypothetical protein